MSIDYDHLREWLDMVDRANPMPGDTIEFTYPGSTVEIVRELLRLRALADAGLLAPDLPEPNDPIIFAPAGRGWLLNDENGPVVWTAPGGTVMVQRIEPGDLTPEEARGVAHALLAAANYAEEQRETKGDEE